jgi:hypothetical protein
MTRTSVSLEIAVLVTVASETTVAVEKSVAVLVMKLSGPFEFWIST